MTPLEKDIEKKVCQFARERGCLVYKFTSPSRRSVPDRLFITPRGYFFLIEFKRKGEKPTPSQEAEMLKIQQKKALVFVVDDVEQGKSGINFLLRCEPTALENAHLFF